MVSAASFSFFFFFSCSCVCCLQDLKEYQDSYVSEESDSLQNVGLDAAAFQQLAAMAASQGKSITHLANELLKKSFV